MDITVLWLYMTVYSIFVLVGQVHSTVKLQNIGTNPEGLVVVDKGNGPRYVCSGCWTRANARVVCHELGYGNGDPYSTEATGYSQLSGYSCYGTEGTLEECYPQHQCPCTMYAAVRCRGAVRLKLTSSSPQIDKIEVYHDCHGEFQWRGLFSSVWGNPEADVACRQIGYRSGIAVGVDSTHGIDFWAGFYNCNGNESILYQCEWKPYLCSTCNTLAGVKCTVDGIWGSWNSWGICSLTCGSGIQMRTRNCDHPKPRNGGADCPGIDQETQACSEFECPVDGNWGRWNSWERCSLTCGSGIQRRTRNCDHPKPGNGGADCPGIDQETQSCNEFECPVDGNLGSWNSWGICSLTCGSGIQRRTRNCDSPKPRNGGADCSRIDQETQYCNEFECPGGDDISTPESIQTLTTEALDTGRTNDSSSSAGSSTFALLGMIAIVPLIGILVFIVIRVKRSRNANATRRTTEQPMELQSPIPDQDRMDTQNAPGVYEGLLHPIDQSRNSQQYDTLGSSISRDSSE